MEHRSSLLRHQQTIYFTFNRKMPRNVRNYLWILRDWGEAYIADDPRADTLFDTSAPHSRMTEPEKKLATDVLVEIIEYLEECI